ncbi:MAG: DUF1761 domain-containing protein [Hyphomicrobiales bacterium]
MAFAGMNYLAIVLAAAAGFLVGWPWYMAFAKSWTRALGKEPGKPAQPGYRPLAVLIVCELVMAFVLAGVIGHLGPGQVTVMNGILSGAFVWAGFVATTMAANHAFQGFGARLTLIDGGHWLLVLLVMGAVIGVMGV